VSGLLRPIMLGGGYLSTMHVSCMTSVGVDVLGAAFKPGSDDVWDSLRGRGACCSRDGRTGNCLRPCCADQCSPAVPGTRLRRDLDTLMP
jgi:hypothetical protein